jgi:hypothetical protein
LLAAAILSHADVAADVDVSVESARHGMRQAGIDDGVVDGQTSAEQKRARAVAQGEAAAGSAGQRGGGSAGFEASRVIRSAPGR